MVCNFLSPTFRMCLFLLVLGGCSGEARSTAVLSPLSDVESKAMLNLHGCNSCHAVDELRLGPAFRSVSQMYNTQSQQAVERLALKIRNGGAGSWGNVPMVANPELSVEESERLARWILSLPADDHIAPKS
jgi:cytochrome c551/c552